MSLEVRPLTLKQANEMVAGLHRHHKPARGHRFSLGVYDLALKAFVGAAIVGRPVARGVNYETTAEVTRLVTDGTKNACSFLYSAAARAAREMGFRKIQTYILETESGISLKAAGWEFEAETAGGSWNGGCRVGRRDDQPLCKKQRWAKALKRAA